MSNENFTQDALIPLIGQNFTAKDQNDNSVELTLIEVNEYHIKGVDAESFSAIFTHEENSILDCSNYCIQHNAIGECNLCISLNSATECEIVINRLNNPIEPPMSTTE